jgi:RNA polymerase sigma factor (sigma-70 family)
MASPRSNVVELLDRSLGRGPAHRTDGQLLELFVCHRDAAAFETLLRRHGPMVLGVCRRLLRNNADAEDAFQATFLVLLRRASGVRPRSMVGNWLYGVARRTALEARRSAARRRAREAGAMARTPTTETATDELREALDRELELLPDKLRAPIVLCDLEGKTRKEAAEHLGWPEGTVATRLASGRRRLAARLARRGFAVSGGVLVAALASDGARAGVSRGLFDATARAVLRAEGGQAAAAVVPASVADLSEGVAKAMLLSRLRVGLPILLTAALLGGGAASLARPLSGEERPVARGDLPAEAKPPQRAPATDLLGDPLPTGAVARIGSGRFRHPEARRLVFSRDGKSFMTGGPGGVRIWDAATGKVRRRFDVPEDWMLGFVSTPEGLAVAGANWGDGKDGVVTARLFDESTGTLLRTLKLPDRATVAYLAYSPNGRRLACTHEKTLRVYELPEGRESLRVPIGGTWARDAEFSPDGKTIAVADITDTVHIYDANDGKVVRRLRKVGEKMLNLVFSPSGRYLAAISSKDDTLPGSAIVWDVSSGEEIRYVKPPGGQVFQVLTVAISPDDRFLAISFQRSDLTLLDLQSGKEVRRFPTLENSYGAVFSPDGKTLAAFSHLGIIRLWDVSTGKPLSGTGDPTADRLVDLRFSVDGKRLLGDVGIHVAWDPATGREVRRFAELADKGWQRPLSPDETLVAAVSNDGTAVVLYDAATGREVRRMQGHENWIHHVLFSSDGRKLYSAGMGRTIREWDVATGKALRGFTAPDDGTGRLVVSRDGRWLASPGSARRAPAVVWDLVTGREKMRLLPGPDTAVHLVALSPDGRTAAACALGWVAGKGNVSGHWEIRLWDLATGRVLQQITHPESLGTAETSINSVTFSPDGRTLATGDFKGNLHLWEVATGKRRHVFVGHESGVWPLAFSPDGRLLAAADAEGPVYVWEVVRSRDGAKLSGKQIDGFWTDLAGDDAVKAFQAVRGLASAPYAAVRLLRVRLKPAPVPNPERVTKLIENLDSTAFAQRQAAAAELEKLGDAAADLLRKAREAASSPETRRQLDGILERVTVLGPESLRSLRAVEALEWMATPVATSLLDELARGAASARQTREAADACARLRARQAGR